KNNIKVNTENNIELTEEFKEKLFSGSGKEKKLDNTWKNCTIIWNKNCTFGEEYINLYGNIVDNIISRKNYKGMCYYHPSYGTSAQSVMTVDVCLMNRLIVLKRFDIIEKYFNEKIIGPKINNVIKEKINLYTDDKLIELIKNMYNTKFKGGLMLEPGQLLGRDGTKSETKSETKMITNQFLSHNLIYNGNYIEIKNTDKTKTEIIRLLQFDYVRAAFEGIYINENIVGMLKYLAKNIGKKSDEIIKNNIGITEQDKRLEYKN